MYPALSNAFHCLDLEKKQLEKDRAREAYLLEEDLGGISSLFYGSPVQEDIIVLRKERRG